MSITLPETNPNVFTQDRIWQAFEASLTCPTDAELAIALQIGESRLKEWKNREPAFYRAIVAARARAGDAKAGSAALSNHIANSLSDELKSLWESLQDDNAPDNPARMALATKGDYDRQRLLVHALASTQFDLSRCMRILNISKATLDRWSRNDTRFVKLWDEVIAAKKNWIESALLDLVGQGNTRAILFANERVNRETYGPPAQRIEGEINHNHRVAVLDLNKLNLDVETRGKILEAVKNAGLIDQDGLIDSDPLRVTEVAKLP